MIGCQRIPLTEVRDIFIFPHLFMSVHYALSYQYFQFMYITCIYLSYHCLGWYTVRIWVFVCVCCAAPDKLTSPPSFTGLGALHVSSSSTSFKFVDMIFISSSFRRCSSFCSLL